MSTRTLLNYNKQQPQQDDVLKHGVQVLRYDGSGHAKQLAWIDEEPLEVLRKLDQAQPKHKFRIILLDWNCLILICQPTPAQQALAGLRQLEQENDPNISYFHNYASPQLYEKFRLRNRQHDQVSQVTLSLLC